MSTYISYHLRIGGRLGKDIAKHQEKIADFLRTLGSETGLDSPSPAGWPQGFIYKGLDSGLKKFEIKEWMAEPSPGGEGTTSLNFLAVASTTLPGKLGDNREEVQKFVDWFTSYREQVWYRDLVGRLQSLHARLDNPGGVIEKVWFRDTGVTINDGGDW